MFTGSAVRMTGSGLGCPDWPQCHGQKIPPLGFHTYVEYGNRLIAGVVGIIVIAASLGAFFRRPYRRHLVILGALLPLGVIAQATLGALVVEYDLNPYLVMNHFILSMLLLDASFALWWCNGHDLRASTIPRATGQHVGGARPDPVRAAHGPARDDVDRRRASHRRPRGRADPPAQLRGLGHAVVARHPPRGHRGCSGWPRWRCGSCCAGRARSGARSGR